MIIDVKNLSVYARSKSGGFPLVKEVNFSLHANECLGILGESGSGKSITCKAVMGLLDERFEVQGEVFFNGRDILKMSAKEKSLLRGKEMCMIIQNPMTAFNPLFSIENQLLETLSTHLHVKDNKSLLALILEAFEKMNLHEGEAILKKYPHQLSGGMLQRIMIALCIALNPSVIIADEPTTAIDVINQVEVINELKKVRELFHTAMIFISHDLSILSQISDKMMVMHQGSIVERGVAKEIIFNPKEAPTKELISTRLKLIEAFRGCVQECVC
ncbi:ABC transporter ATP-binding protein [Sulfurospirillum barnesii]|uniref:ABC-type dipeptide/oligopeptide/nickel transport system, ATPase component n=1 Tax=Sulfurospirillum barnesii (strain ATCC 700032 / DSM 10660 / SES-3) TaxID=760154 RepID=I3XTU6_SULBS|nr:ABC transporter ATP-binding protein [Sulfurospirillum barnesii]AFL67370.1 ABC-type dipeptide/oligopeptide/nickel transport system, ATPase component [Sulfurospirillum barnesii SES-3]